MDAAAAGPIWMIKEQRALFISDKDWTQQLAQDVLIF